MEEHEEGRSSDNMDESNPLKCGKDTITNAKNRPKGSYLDIGDWLAF
jgi:hypothetical protein